MQPILEDELGDIIAKARAGLGLSVDELAAIAGVPSNIIQDAEKYRYTLNSSQLVRIAEALNLDPIKLRNIAENNWAPEPVKLPDNAVSITLIPTAHGQYQENCYIIADKKSKTAAVIDPGGNVNAIRNIIEKGSYNPGLVLITHYHSDHVGGLVDLAKLYPNVKIVCNEMERELAMRGLKLEWVEASEEAEIKLGNIRIRPILTPGHTEGSTCYAIDYFCFTGDTLFAGSIGRPLNPGIYKKMLSSIEEKILALSNNTILLPGHGPPTTVWQEKEHNPFLGNMSEHNP